MEESKSSRDSLINEYADLRLAKKHNVSSIQHASMIRMLDFPDIDEYDMCECCNLPIDAPLFPITCPLKNLSELGIGFPLYFYFTLNAMIILALAITIAAIPCMVSNLMAGHSGDWGEGSESWEIDLSIGAYGNSSSVPKWQGILHSICSLVMILNTVQLRRFLGKKTRHIDILSFSPARYAVWIRGLDKDYNRDELKTFLEDNGREDGRFAEVYDISSAYDIRSFQRAKKRYEKYQRKLIFTKAYFEKYRTHPQSSMICCKYYPSQRELKLQIEIQKQTYKAIEKNILDGLKNIGVCFVTFQKKSDAKAVAEHWDQGAFFRFFHTLCNCLYDNRLSFKGKHISLKQAPEPSDIIWENLSLNPYQRNCRRIITALATILLLAGSLTSVYFLKARQREIYKDYTNKSELNRTTLSLMEVEAFSLLVSLSILTINQLIDAFVRVLSYKEKHHTWTNFYKASSHKLVIGLSLNSAIILIIVNASSTEDLFKPYGLVNDVFFLLTATSILNPVVYFFHPIWIYTLWRRGEVKNQKDGTLGLTQSRANEIWENPPIDIIQLYPNIIVTLIVAFIFAPLFPFGLVIAFCGVFFQYWTDKYLLLRRSSRPRQLGKGLSISMQSWLPIIIFIYSVSNCYTQYIMKKDNVYFPLLFTSFVAWYFLFPWRHICKRKIKLYKLIEDDADQDYKNQVVHFYEDYVRSNPITKKTAWENWLGIIKKKKGKNEEEDMRKRISTLINGKSPVKNFAIQNYKLEEGRRSLFLKSSARDFKKPNSDLEISPMPRFSEGREFSRRSYHANPFRIHENNP